jgi:hypothetical protein
VRPGIAQNKRIVGNPIIKQPTGNRSAILFNYSLEVVARGSFFD